MTKHANYGLMKTSEIRERMIFEKKNFELMKKTSFEFRLENF